MIHAFLAVCHVLASAAWLGAMVYSCFFLTPRAHAYFSSDREFESFILTVSHGARWLVLCALGTISATGLALLALPGASPRPPSWWVFVALKMALWMAAAALFWYVSWRLWPARVFATANEVPAVQKSFARWARVMIALVTSAMILGILAHSCWLRS